MTFQPLTGFLITIVFCETVTIMAGWHIITKGAWTTFPAGRVLMGILGTLGASMALAAVSSFSPDFAFRPYLYVVLYVVLILVMGWLGWTIFAEQHRRGKPLRRKTNPTRKG